MDCIIIIIIIVTVYLVCDCFEFLWPHAIFFLGCFGCFLLLVLCAMTFSNSLRSMGVVGRYHYEIAELYYGSLKEEGLTVQMVEVDDE